MTGSAAASRRTRVAHPATDNGIRPSLVLGSQLRYLGPAGWGDEPDAEPEHQEHVIGADRHHPRGADGDQAKNTRAAGYPAPICDRGGVPPALEASGPLLASDVALHAELLDLGTAQQVLARDGKVDQVDVRAEGGVTAAELFRRGQEDGSRLVAPRLTAVVPFVGLAGGSEVG